jgi:hypothetical protein
MATLYAPRIVTDGLVLSLDAADSFSYASNTLDVEYLIVAGGGGGSNRHNGGGGAGGLLMGKTTVSSTSHSVVVGAGGNGAPQEILPDRTPGTNGGNSSVFGVTATGGGRADTTGGSGGGGGVRNSGALGVSGQGNQGGAGSISPSVQSAFAGGGGGGAGSIGSAAGPGGTNASRAGDGGDGLLLNISGNGVYYAGGGGGGAACDGIAGGLGGLGGGGNGSHTSAGQPGQINTGGGGGSGGFCGGDNYASGAGGSGIVIIRYRGPQRASGGTVTTSNGWTIHTFTSSGTFTVGSHVGDLSGNGNNGQLVNGPTFDSANGGSLVFDGIDDYVDLGINSIFNLIPTNIWTIQVWVKRVGISGYFISKGYTSAANQQYAIWTDSNSINYTIGGSTQTISVSLTSEWYLLTLVCNGNGTFSGYNGANLVVSGNTSALDRSTTSTMLGARRATAPNSGSGFPFTGNISQVQIYNRALTAQEVLQNYNATKGRYGL